MPIGKTTTDLLPTPKDRTTILHHQYAEFGQGVMHSFMACLYVGTPIMHNDSILIPVILEASLHPYVYETVEPVMTPIDIIILILLFLITLLLFILFWRFPWQQTPVKPPVVLLDAKDINEIEDKCGSGNTLFTNLTASDMDVNVELTNSGDCDVALSTDALGNFLVVRADQAGPRAAAIPLARKAFIKYKCTQKVGENGPEDCSFAIKITRI